MTPGSFSCDRGRGWRARDCDTSIAGDVVMSVFGSRFIYMSAFEKAMVEGWSQRPERPDAKIAPPTRISSEREQSERNSLGDEIEELGEPSVRLLPSSADSASRCLHVDVRKFISTL